MTLMQINSNKIEFLVGDMEVLQNMQNTPALPAFSGQAIAFFADLSRELLKDARARQYVDIMSYAYWIRKASIESVRSKHVDYQCRLGRGIAFHIAPSNVPVNFAVSMTSSVLAGNCTLIRVSNKQFPQVDIICHAMNKLLKAEHLNMRPYFCLIRYEHNDDITRELSAICDVRIIWGGNRTIETIRQAPLPPRAIEMAFADRYSIAIINSDEYMKGDPKEIAKGFYTDTYYSDQNACSSPRLVVWMGNYIKTAKEKFWNELEVLVRNDYEMKPIQAVDKYTSVCILGMKENHQHLVSKDNYVVRMEVDALKPDLMNYKNGGGYFFEYSANKLEEIEPILTKQCQTISVYGIDKNAVKKLVFDKGVRGVDRIVEMGQTMGLEFIWDGYKMIETMSRFVYTGGYL